MVKIDMWHTKCKDDAYGRHCFEKLGTDGVNIIYYCSQCRHCFREKIKWLEDCDDLEVQDYRKGR